MQGFLEHFCRVFEGGVRVFQPRKHKALGPLRLDFNCRFSAGFRGAVAVQFPTAMAQRLHESDPAWTFWLSRSTYSPRAQGPLKPLRGFRVWVLGFGFRV